jgi:hypothetical protein
MPRFIFVDGKHAGVLTRFRAVNASPRWPLTHARHPPVSSAPIPPHHHRWCNAHQCGCCQPHPRSPPWPCVHPHGRCAQFESGCPASRRLQSPCQHRTSVDTGVGTDLHIVANAHCAELLDLDPALVFRRKTKTISSNHHTRMQNAVLSNMAMRRDSNPRFQAGASTNHSALFHHAQGPNLNAGMHLRAWVHHGAGVYQGTRSEGAAISGISTAGWFVPNRHKDWGSECMARCLLLHALRRSNNHTRCRLHCWPVELMYCGWLRKDKSPWAADAKGDKPVISRSGDPCKLPPSLSTMPA